MRIGVLALQGDFIEHQQALDRLGVEGVAVRLPEQLDGLAGLILPGGESTAIGKLLAAYGLVAPLQAFAATHPVWGTCAGAILLAKDLGGEPPWLNLMDIAVGRNAFGRQVASFETDLEVPALCRVDPDPRPYHAIFIRAPLIEAVHGPAQALARLPDGRIVAARQGTLLATAFHPELTGDDRFHRYFLELVRSKSVL